MYICVLANTQDNKLRDKGSLATLNTLLHGYWL